MAFEPEQVVDDALRRDGENASAAARKEPRAARRPLPEWRGLVAARWNVVAVLERDGKRFLVAEKAEKTNRKGLGRLSGRELQALEHLTRGLNNKRIAHALGISPSTVSVLLHRAGRKLDASSRFDLVRRYLAWKKREDAKLRAQRRRDHSRS